MLLWTDQDERAPRPPAPAGETLRARMERQLRDLIDPDVATVIRGLAVVVEVVFFPDHFDVRCPSCGPHPGTCYPGCPCTCHEAPPRGAAADVLERHRRQREGIVLADVTKPTGRV